MPLQRYVNGVAAPVSIPAAFWDLISGWKSITVGAVEIAKLWYVAIEGHPWPNEIDVAINGTLITFGVLALRDTVKTAIERSTAKLASAVVNPASPEAQATAAEVPTAPVALTLDEQAQLFKLIQKVGGK